MINGIGVLAWGVGGARGRERDVRHAGDAAHPGGRRRAPHAARCATGVLATDLALTVTRAAARARRRRAQFVEFFGPGVSTLSAGDRAVVANMAPEYGASTGFFPVDEQTLATCARPAATPAQVAAGRGLCEAAGALVRSRRRARATRDTIEIDLGGDRHAASPARAGRRIAARRARRVEALAGLWDVPLRPGRPRCDRAGATAPVAIAAITSCTNTSRSRACWSPPACSRARRARSASRPSRGSRPRSRRARRRPRATCGAPACSTTWRRSASASSATAAPPASAIPVRLPPPMQRGDRGARRASRSRCSPATATSPAACIAQIEPASWPRRRWSSPIALAGDVDRDILTRADRSAADGPPVHLARPLADAATRSTRPSRRPPIRPTTRGAYEAAEASDVWHALDAPATPRLPVGRGARPTSAARRSRRPTRRRALGRYVAHPLLVLGDDITTDHISPAGADPGATATPPTTWSRAARTATTSTCSPRAAATGKSCCAACSRTAPRATSSARRRRPARRVHVPSGEVLPLWRAAERYRDDGHARRPRRRRALRHRLVARLGRQGPGAARRARGARRQLRAHPPLEPDRHGHPAAAAAGRAASDGAAPRARRPDRDRRSRRTSSRRARWSR